MQRLLLARVAARPVGVPGGGHSLALGIRSCGRHQDAAGCVYEGCARLGAGDPNRRRVVHRRGFDVHEPRDKGELAVRVPRQKFERARSRGCEGHLGCAAHDGKPVCAGSLLVHTNRSQGRRPGSRALLPLRRRSQSPLAPPGCRQKVPRPPWAR